MLVVDASVAFKWVVREHDGALALALAGRGEALIAPELVLIEVANAVWKGVQRGLVAPEQLTIAVERLPDWLDQLHPTRPLLPRGAAIARELPHPIYGCLYLALAEGAAATLVTADRRLLARTAGKPWASLVQDLAVFGSVPR